MAWCPKCKCEYVEGVDRCADCGCELVEHLTDEPEGEVHRISPGKSGRGDCGSTAGSDGGRDPTV